MIVKVNNRKLHFYVANSLCDKIVGLMFSKKPKNMCFPIESGHLAIHSFFVSFPFYAVYVDYDNTITENFLLNHLLYL